MKIWQIDNEIPPMFYNDYVAGFEIQAFSLSFEEEFEINRPFVYSIKSRNEENAIQLFSGLVTDPSY